MSCLSRLLRRTFSTATKKSLTNVVYGERNLERLVVKFKEACESSTFRANTAVYDRTLRRLAAAKKFQLVEEILEDQKKYPNVSKEGFNARIISQYGKAGMFDHAQKVFDEIPERNCKRTVLSFNALLGACLNSKKFDLIEGLFRELPGKLSIEPDLVSYNTLIKALCKKGSFDDAVALLDEIESKGFVPDAFTFNTLLSESYKNGQFERGEEIWVKMLEKNVVPDFRSYTTRLLGLAGQKKSKDLVDFFEEMTNKGIKHDVFSFNAMIRGFVNEEQVDKAKTWYEEMKNKSCRPNKATFAMLLPSLCKSGDLGSAFELCKEIFSNRYLVEQEVLQQVVDELVKGSKRQEAEEIVKLAKSSNHLQYELCMPSE